MQISERTIEYYRTSSGKIPFREWFYSFKNQKDQNIIRNRLDRISLGNMGDCVSIGEGLFELRIHYGPGYRIYFGQIGHKIILLLCGGTKKKQSKDITRAREY